MLGRAAFVSVTKWCLNEGREILCVSVNMKSVNDNFGSSTGGICKFLVGASVV